MSLQVETGPRRVVTDLSERELLIRGAAVNPDPAKQFSKETLGTDNSFQVKSQHDLAGEAAKSAIMQATKDPMVSPNEAKRIADAYIMGGIPLSAGLSGDLAKEQIATLARDYTNIARIKAELEKKRRGNPPPEPELVTSQTNRPGGPDTASSQKQAQQIESEKKIAQRVDEGGPKEGPTAEALRRPSPLLNSLLAAAAEEGSRNNLSKSFSGPLKRDPLSTVLTVAEAAAQALQETPEQKRQREEAQKAQNRAQIADHRKEVTKLSAELDRIRELRGEYLAKKYQNQAEIEEHKKAIERLVPYT
ncbi:MAG: hypothetical protein GX589_02100 [Deltaproteobacteria bacterium]|nr:hypothetical protein [Deltaproteobacteria bacterium]